MRQHQVDHERRGETGRPPPGRPSPTTVHVLGRALEPEVGLGEARFVPTVRRPARLEGSVSTQQLGLRRVALVLDFVAIGLAMIAAGVAHYALRVRFEVFKDPPPLEQYMLLAWLTIPMMLGLSALIGLHRQFERPFQPLALLWDLLRLHAWSLIGIALLVFLTQIPLNRSLVALFLLLTFTFMCSTRFVLQEWRRRTHRSGAGRAHLLLVSNDPALVSLIANAAAGEPLAPTLIGTLACSPAQPGSDVAGVPALGHVENIRRVLHDRTVDEVIVAASRMTPEQFGAVAAACEELGTPIRQLILPEHLDGRGFGLERQYGLPFLTFSTSERSTEALAIKRTIDVLGSAAALLVLAPLLLAIAGLILLAMGRPILFRQERIGYRGRRFRMLKFRSMVRDAERQRDALAGLNEVDGPAFKITADPRVTPLGRFLRKYSLDELPQLFNVIGGSMSLVGPRPLPVPEQQLISGPMRRRLSMKPGITGLWQISGRSDVSFEQWMQWDLEYLDRWSNLLDLKILLLTIPAVIAGKGAK